MQDERLPWRRRSPASSSCFQAVLCAVIAYFCYSASLVLAAAMITNHSPWLWPCKWSWWRWLSSYPMCGVWRGLSCASIFSWLMRSWAANIGRGTSWVHNRWCGCTLLSWILPCSRCNQCLSYRLSRLEWSASLFASSSGFCCCCFWWFFSCRHIVYYSCSSIAFRFFLWLLMGRQ